MGGSEDELLVEDGPSAELVVAVGAPQGDDPGVLVRRRLGPAHDALGVVDHAAVATASCRGEKKVTKMAPG